MDSEENGYMDQQEQESQDELERSIPKHTQRCVTNGGMDTKARSMSSWMTYHRITKYWDTTSKYGRTGTAVSQRVKEEQQWINTKNLLLRHSIQSMRYGKMSKHEMHLSEDSQ